MKLTINGELHEYPKTLSVRDLLKELNIQPERVAILVNDDVVSSPRRNSVMLQDGDRIEILTFAGGG